MLWGRRVCWWWGVGTVDLSARPLCWRLSRVRWSRFCGFVSRIEAARVYGITPLGTPWWPQETGCAGCCG